MFFSEITTATSGNTSMANTVKSHEYALAVCTEKGQFWWVYIRGGAYIQGGVCVCGGGSIFHVVQDVASVQSKQYRHRNTYVS